MRRVKRKEPKLPKRQQLRHDIIDGCREMAEIYLEIEAEYHPLEEEVQQTVESIETGQAAESNPAACPPQIK
jgi:hypothetical protein